MRPHLTLLIAMAFLATDCFAQSRTFRYETGVSVGTVIYQGDLTPAYYGYIKELNASLGINASLYFNPTLSVRAAMLYSKIRADESQYATPEFRRYRNFRFSSSLLELSGQLVYSPLAMQEYRKVFPYVYAGAGITLLNVKRDWSRFQHEYFNKEGIAAVSLIADSLHALPQMIPVIPVGAGIRYELTPALSVNTELTLRLSSSDYMDGFSYQETKKNDKYYGFTVGFVYRFLDALYACPR